MKTFVMYNAHPDEINAMKAIMKHITALTKTLNPEELSTIEYKNCANRRNIEELKKRQK